MKQIFIFLFCIVGGWLFGQTKIDSGQIRRVNLPKIVTPTQEIIFGTGTGAKSDPKIKVDSTLNSIEVRGTGTKVSKTSMQPGYVEMRGDTTADNNVFLKILDGRASPYTYAPFGLSVEYGNPSQTPYKNYVWTIGPNAAGNTGVAFDATKPMASKNWETSWIEGGVPTFEIHEHFKIPDSTAIRLNSYTIRYPNATTSNRLIDVDKYESADRFYVKHWKQNNTYFATQWNRTTRAGQHSFALNDSSSLLINGTATPDGNGSIVTSILNSETSARTQILTLNGFSQYNIGDTGSGAPTGFKWDASNSKLTVRSLKNHDNYNTFIEVLHGFNIIPNGINHGIILRDPANTATRASYTANEGNGEIQMFVRSGGWFSTFYSSGSEAMRLNPNQEMQIGSTTDAGNFKLQVTGGSYVSGNIGIGITSTTSRLHLPAGTATASTAPLKFTSGTNITTAEAGAVEYDGTEFYATPSSASRTILARVLKGSATLDFASTAAGSVTDLTITVTGAADGDVVSVGVPNASQTATGHFFGWVSATNTVTIRYAIAALTGSENPASGTFKATVTK